MIPSNFGDLKQTSKSYGLKTPGTVIIDTFFNKANLFL